ncbi:hypothetical protein KY285_025472 [Solanum tuberosum]|nr:hypothetical protein KY289_025750 [Solanum tuberosum]KAH0677671.1 hypothetical protein KY285_025472 [Solanum tuberosum]
MGYQLSRGEELVKKVEKKLNAVGDFSGPSTMTLHIYSLKLFIASTSLNHRQCHDLEKATHLFLDTGRLNATRGHYQILDKTYTGTRECKFLMDEWRTPVLLKMKEVLKAKELDSKGQ